MEGRELGFALLSQSPGSVGIEDHAAGVTASSAQAGAPAFGLGASLDYASRRRGKGSRFKQRLGPPGALP